MPLLALAALLVLSRVPLWPGQLFSFDDVNLAYSLGDFDVRLSQPHPPGYPLFVAQLHVLRALRFRRPESMLLALSLLGSLAALALTVRCGRRLFGGATGMIAAVLLLFHPSFWYAGLTSALRLQLAVVSLGVAIACHRCWTGERGWGWRSALVLGVGAGARPELLLLLFPLWLTALLRGVRSWRERITALLMLTGGALLWLVPTIVASGGPAAYLETCRAYLQDQAGVTSSLFGAAPRQWQTTAAWLVAWVLGGVVAWPLPAVLAWSARDSFGLRRLQLAFLALWFVPGFAFAWLVHVADAGQSLALVPVVCLAGGHLIRRAADRVATTPSRWHTLAVLLLPCGLVVLYHSTHPTLALALLIPWGLAAGWLMRHAPVLAAGVIPRAQTALVLLTPALFLHAMVFLTPGWYYRGDATTGWRATAQQVWHDLHGALYLCSLDQVRDVMAVDDRLLKAVSRAVADTKRPTTVLWHRAPTSWRKVAYYHPRVPVVVLDRRGRRPDSPRIAIWYQGAKQLRIDAGGAPVPVRVPAGARLVWMLEAGSPLRPLLERRAQVRQSDGLLLEDLPASAGEMDLGSYRLEWRP